MIDFTIFFSRIKQETAIATQHDLAKALGVNRSAITQAKRRNSVPQKWVLSLSRSYQLSPDWLEFGKGTPNASTENQDCTPDTSIVPKVLARVCAGDGSQEVEATPIEEHIFKTSWLAQKGSPSSMVLMDVVGDSMEPTICQNDTILVDQSQTTIRDNSIFAIGIEDSIMIKRIESSPNNIILHSDNEQFSPIHLQGDELLSFRIIGKVVWSARDY